MTSIKPPEGMPERVPIKDEEQLSWQARTRGHWHWQRLDKKPDRWWMQTEYRSLDAKGNETWRSPHVNGYDEKPPCKNEWVKD